MYVLKVLVQNVVLLESNDDELNRKKDLIFIIEDFFRPGGQLLCIPHRFICHSWSVWIFPTMPLPRQAFLPF